jgi:hypothetical protein
MGSTIGACLSTNWAMPFSMGVDVTKQFDNITSSKDLWMYLMLRLYLQGKTIVNSKVVYDKSSRKEVLNH